MRIRSAILVALSVLALGAPVANAEPSGVLTIVGTATAWVDVDLPSTVTIDRAKTMVTTKGRFAGFYVDVKQNTSLSTGALLQRDFHGRGSPDEVHGLGPGDEPLSRGRYRLYLIADGPTTIQVPVTGMTSRTIRPTRRTTAASRVDALPVVGGKVSGRRPVVANARSVSRSALLIDGNQLFAGSIAVCLTRPEGRCDGTWDGEHDGSWYVNPLGPFTFIFCIEYLPGVKAGRLDALQQAWDVTGFPYAMGASFTLALV